MEIIKDIFFLIGSIAGIFGLASRIIESKFQEDKRKLNNILENLSEEKIIVLADRIWHSRFAPFEILDKYEKFSRQMREKTSDVYFSGPLKKEINEVLSELVFEYENLRTYLQVPAWNPVGEDNISGYIFDRTQFSDIGDDYVEHIQNTHNCTLKIRNAIKKLQVLSNFHFFETYYSRFILKSRYKEVFIPPYS